MSKLSRNIGYENSIIRLTNKEKNKQKIVKWLENRENKTAEEIAALECAKKDNVFKVMIIYVIFLVLLVIGAIVGALYIDLEKILLLFLCIIIVSVIVVININSLVNRDFNKLVERIARFTDLYLSEHRSKFAIKFNGANINEYDFAQNFVNYANQNSREFEEKWSQTKPFTVLEKAKTNLMVFIFFLIILGIPIFFAFKDSGLSLKKIVYNQELRRADYIIIDQEYIDNNKIMVTIEYTIDNKKYITDVEVEGEYRWMIYGGLYYKSNNPKKIIYIKDN